MYIKVRTRDRLSASMKTSMFGWFNDVMNFKEVKFCQNRCFVEFLTQ